MRSKASVVVGLALLLAGCSATVDGTPTAGAPPADTENEVVAGEPCGLLSPEQATGLGYAKEPKFHAAQPDNLTPPLCVWTPEHDDPNMEQLYVNFSVDIPLADYVTGASPEWEKEFGQLEWGRYPDPVGGESLCTLATELTPTSFVGIMSSNYSDPAEACSQAEAAAAFVASHLPGGGPAPEIEPERPGPLASVEPCSLLTPEQAEKLGRRSGTPREAEEDTPAKCVWESADGDKQNTTIAEVAPDRPAPERQEEPTPVKVDGREWKLYPTTLPGLCEAILPVTEKSYVGITVTEADAEMDAVCAKVEDTIALVTKNLPET